MNGHSYEVFNGTEVAEEATSWNFIPPDSSPNTSLTEDPELERYLVEEIARATRRRPLMKRLANVEAAFTGLPDGLHATTHTANEPPPLPSAPAIDLMGVANPAIHPINDLMEEYSDTWTTPPPSAEWLRKARRERRRARARTFFAWSATLAIGIAIVALTMQALQQP